METSPAIKPLIDELITRFESSEEGLIAVTDLAVLVAAADDTIDADEMKALTTSLHGLLGGQLAPMLVRHVVEESRERIGEAGAEASAQSIGEALAKKGAAEQGLRLALLIAAASEGVSDVERARIDLVAKAAGVPGERMQALADEV